MKEETEYSLSERLAATASLSSRIDRVEAELRGAMRDAAVPTDSITPPDLHDKWGAIFQWLCTRNDWDVSIAPIASGYRCVVGRPVDIPDRLSDGATLPEAVGLAALDFLTGWGQSELAAQDTDYGSRWRYIPSSLDDLVYFFRCDCRNGSRLRTERHIPCSECGVDPGTKPEVFVSHQCFQAIKTAGST